MYIYEKGDSLAVPFKLQRIIVQNKDARNSNAAVTSIGITSTEDVVYFSQEMNQLKKCTLNLQGGFPQNETKDKFDPERYTSSYEISDLICDFHSGPVTGLDVCIRKQLIATCSTDKSIKIWNYMTKSLEITEHQTEECQAIAFHPSGFHLVCALNDKILLMNIFLDKLTTFDQVTLK